jgi:hypothetical protein
VISGRNFVQKHFPKLRMDKMNPVVRYNASVIHKNHDTYLGTLGLA